MKTPYKIVLANGYATRGATLESALATLAHEMAAQGVTAATVTHETDDAPPRVILWLDFAGADSALARITGAKGGDVSAACYLESGVMLANEVTGRWSSGDLAGAVNALEEWAGDVQAEFPALDYDPDSDGVPVVISVLEIGAGDRVDLEGAPGCDGDSFIGAEFEFAVCIGAERESPDCVRLDFADLPSVGFDTAVSLPVIKATPEEAAKWAE